MDKEKIGQTTIVSLESLLNLLAKKNYNDMLFYGSAGDFEKMAIESKDIQEFMERLNEFIFNKLPPEAKKQIRKKDKW